MDPIEESICRCLSVLIDHSEEVEKAILDVQSWLVCEWALGRTPELFDVADVWGYMCFTREFAESYFSRSTQK